MSISACRIAVVLGATGGIGGETALALSRHGWKIRAFSRTTSPSSDSAAWEWVKGDALDRAGVLAASEGAQVIVHAVNPPGYRNWAKLVLPMIDNTIAAAKASGARVLLPVLSTTTTSTPSGSPRGISSKCDDAQGKNSHRVGEETQRCLAAGPALVDLCASAIFSARSLGTTGFLRAWSARFGR